MRNLLNRVVFLLCLCAVVLPAFSQNQPESASRSISANEKSARLSLREKDSIFSLELSATSASPPIAQLFAKIVSPDGKTIAENATPLQLTPQPRRFQVPLKWIPSPGLAEVSSTRLVYEVRLGGATVPALSGIVSPSKIIPEVFELRFIGLDSIGLGKTYFARVRAVRPDTPVSGVALAGFLGDDEDANLPKQLKPTARTNAQGEAVLKFRLPELAGAPDDSELDLEIRGSLGNFKNSLTSTLRFWRRAMILVSTDKPLYQPEQVLHMRALLIDDQRNAWAGQSLHFVVRDPDDTVVFSADAATSRFGISSADWQIPASQKLGSYRIAVESLTDEKNRDFEVNQSVHISRYELPTFTVNVQPNRPFYTPGQNAELTVSASYLFGQPVLRGHVRVLRENSRTWNFQDQKWDVDETPLGEGDLDPKHEFHASIDLTKDHSEFHDKDWTRFEDLRFAAYVTDASSGRTQERHFDLRISHEPMHLYVLNSSDSVAAALPPVLYVSSSFADGTPAPAELQVRLFAHDPSDTTLPQQPNPPLLSANARANKFGIARIAFAEPFNPDAVENDRIYASIEAKSPDGRTATHVESYSVAKDRAFRITATKVIHNSGDPIVAKIECSAPGTRARVDLVRANTQSILASQEVKLSRGSTRITFPPNDDFVGKIALIAYSPDAEVSGYYASAAAGSSSVVVFPEPSTLKLDVTPLKKPYRPGDSAAVRLLVRGTQNETTESALGFLVYDQAMEELARNEASLTTNRYESVSYVLGFQNPLGEDSSVAGIHEQDLLNRVSGAPVSSDVELAAQALYSGQAWFPLRLETSDSARDFRSTFSAEIARTLNPVGTPVQDFFNKVGHFPADETAYASILKEKGFDASQVLDPWGRPYRIRRTFSGSDEVFEFRSDGPDKAPNTADDFTAYELRRRFFEHDESLLRSVVDAYQKRTGTFIRDEATLKLACEEAHFPLSSLVDPWGTPYRFQFTVDRDAFSISINSAGPDKKFHIENPREYVENDDVNVSNIRSFYFSEIAQRIDAALLENAKATAHFPENEEEFRDALQRSGLDWAALRDPWGHPYRFQPSIKYDYSDKITVRAYGSDVSSKVSPVTRALKGITIFTNGPDGIANNSDDVFLASFVSPFREESGGAGSAARVPEKEPVFYSGSTGAIRAVVKDQTGAVISNAKLTATNQATGVEYSGTANDQGVCLVAHLPAGFYRVLVQSPGFQAYVLTSVPVFSSNATNIEVTLSVGAITQSVEVVTVEAAQLQTSTSVLSLAQLPPGAVAITTKSGAAKGVIDLPLATPHLREYFPETLLWRPEVLTDRAGQATVKFPLADSITTWKVSVIASTLDGRIATASADLRAFQPFFAELDPPKVLTVGDEIHLPVTVRNYLEKQQSVSLDWSAEPWSQTLSPRAAQLDVPAGDYSQKVFSFRAALPEKNARQRVTAFNRSTKNESDAIERKLRVHPDGQERLLQANSIFSGSASLSLDLPANSLPGSIEAELVIYPSLFAHISDAIEGIMERPYGCAEQTISSAYPSLLWLQFQKSLNSPASPLDARAKHYLNLAYARLLGYRDSAGGFSYWGKGDAYIPLTAYALRFLSEASEFISVDPEIIAGTRHWLLQQASPDGTWTLKGSTGQSYDWSRNYYTSYVDRILSEDLLSHDPSRKTDIESERKLVSSGIQYLSKSVAGSSDPYHVVLLALAKLSVEQDASSEISWLLANKHVEAETIYWDLQQNTLFHGWGLAGRIETTALVLDALATAKLRGNTDPAIESALNLGTRFVLKNKDRFNVWYSTQATVNVLQSLVHQLARNSSNPSPAESRVLILIDGKPGPELPPSQDARQLMPQRVDLSSYLGPGPHHVEIRGGSFRNASAYLNAVYYLPWTDPSVVQSFAPSGDSESVRYAVQFDRTSLSIGDQVRCTVHAERAGFRGYGMLLAEVGLPPGADVDRASLDAAVAGNWAVQSYEVQPDRIVLYLWPQAGGTTFSFTFKLRFGMNAKSSESILYDYYNPLARASVEPVRFTVR